MQKISRRKFLCKASQTFMGLAAAGLVHPRFSVAAVPGDGKRVLLIELNGGWDDWHVFPGKSGPVRAKFDELRPTVTVPTANVIVYHSGQSGSDIRGFHPSFLKLLNLNPNITLVQQLGIKEGDPGGSHNTCQNIVSRGDLLPATAKLRNQGYLARIMDIRELEARQVWGIGTGYKMDFAADLARPYVVTSLDSFSFRNRSFSGSPEVNHCQSGSNSSCRSSYAEDDELVSKIQKELRDVGTLDTPLKDAFSNVFTQTDAALSEVSALREIATVGNYRRGADDSLSPTSFCNACRDAARVFIGLASDPQFGDKNVVISVVLGGWDTHGAQVNNLNSKVDELASALRGFIQDIRSAGIEDGTVITTHSEFGRTVNEKGTGTDHGWANSGLVIGTDVANSIKGPFPTINELSTQTKLTPNLDIRDYLTEIFSYAGLVNASNQNELRTVFPRLTHSPLGIFS